MKIYKIEKYVEESKMVNGSIWNTEKIKTTTFEHSYYTSRKKAEEELKNILEQHKHAREYQAKFPEDPLKSNNNETMIYLAETKLDNPEAIFTSIKYLESQRIISKIYRIEEIEVQ